MQSESVLAFLKKCRSVGAEVPSMEISKLGPLTFVTSFAERPSDIMANSATCGVSSDSETAAMKALVEFYERRVFAEGIRRGDTVCSRTHSDGVASYPIIECLDYVKEARNRAYAEAWERYVWANWWDNDEYAHKYYSFESSDHSNLENVKQTIEELGKIIPIESLQVIEPITGNKDLQIIILFLKMRDLGYISGGAAGVVGQPSDIFIAALSELIRHGIAVKRFLKTKKLPKSFYEKRLMFFGCGDGNRLVEERLHKVGKKIINTPKLEHDCEIETTSLKNLIYTHRCLFEGQPPFVDGKLERLCL
jgi:hypothetical protein